MKIAVFLLSAAVLSAAQPLSSCQTLAHHGKREGARDCFRKAMESPAAATRAEALWALADFEGANREFKSAVAAQPRNPDVRVRWGRLFLERFNGAEAQKLFKEALEIKADHAGAWMGLALVAADSFEKKAVEGATTALKFDPKLVEAQELLARLALEDSNPTKAAAEADAALTMDPEALDAMAVHAAIDLLDNEPDSAWFAKIAAINPVYGKGRALVGHFLVLNRRYEEGIGNYRKALELEPDLHEARSDLGINLMRLGLEKEAREQLTLAFNRGYRNNSTVNSLRLIDSYKNFITYTTPTTVVRLHKKEAELLRPYVEGELKRAMVTYEKKYGLKLDGPVQVEVYPDHEDFAVRTMGMPGLGALGVTFGNVVAMDSPSGRKPGSFHWASTLWHELSHVYVLSATKHRVPRWFTEGMAVHEETAAAPDWGDRLDPQVLRAVKDGKLLPIAELDRGFIRPSYPSQVVVSYFQAGRICDFINEKWGYATLLAMMHAFGESKPTPEVVRAHLRVEPEAFDKQFLAWLDKQVRPTISGYEEWQKHMKILAARTSGPDDVIKSGKAAITIFPDFVEGMSPYEAVAEAFEKRGDKENARKQLEQYSDAGGRTPATLKKLAQMQIEASHSADAIRTYERLMYIYPMDEESHRKLGELYLAVNNKDGAVREFGAAVASKPADEAGARFDLAKAFHAAQRTEEAKEQLLLSLEAAPGFRPAQRLLLQLSR